MLSRSVLMLLTGLGLAACRPQPVDVGSAAGGVQPFGTLQGVQLGMTARELARTRPAARPEGYTGYVETIEGFSVGYSIPGSYSEDQQVSPRARVRSVAAVRNVAGLEQGISDWLRIVRVAHSSLGSMPECSRVDTQSGTVGVEARWERPGSIFTVGLYETRTTQGTPYAVGIVLSVSTKANAAHLRSRIDCTSELDVVLDHREVDGRFCKAVFRPATQDVPPSGQSRSRCEKSARWASFKFKEAVQ